MKISPDSFVQLALQLAYYRVLLHIFTQKRLNWLWKICMMCQYVCPTYWSSTFQRGRFWLWDGTSSYLSHVMCLYTHSACTTAWMNDMFYTGSCLLDYHLICSMNFRKEGLSVWHMKPPWRVCFVRVARRLYALAPMKAVPLSLHWMRERWCQCFEFFNTSFYCSRNIWKWNCCS